MDDLRLLRAHIGVATLLHIAAYRGDQEIISLLLQHGSDKNARMPSGARPIDLALQTRPPGTDSAP
jgi:ankyrin repeat protein